MGGTARVKCTTPPKRCQIPRTTIAALGTKTANLQDRGVYHSGRENCIYKLQGRVGTVLSVIRYSAFAEEFLGLPENSAIVLAAAADGVQIYESKPNPLGGFRWSLKAPEAELTSLSGEIVGSDGAGPSWTLNDGSSIVASLPP